MRSLEPRILERGRPARSEWMARLRRAVIWPAGGPPALPAGGLLVLALLATIAWQPDVPNPPTAADVRAAACPSDARLLDRHGVVLHERRVDQRRRRLAWTPLDAVSPALIDAVLTSEDRRFHTHGGVDLVAVAAAAWQRLRGGAPRGASTNAMELAALLDPSLRRPGAPRGAAAKWRQMRAAWRLEAIWSKDEILDAYLNLVTFRGELQGIAAAAEVLFGKAPHGLSTAEATVLASLLRAPNAERPALARRAAALRRADGGSGTAALDAAIARVIDVTPHLPARRAEAPHLARRLLPEGDACDATTTTLDAAVQSAARDAVQRHLLALHGRGVRDAAVLVADNGSGDVLAYVGSSGALSAAAQVDGVRAARQAGSTLKPFLYAAAIEQRLLTAASRLDDTPLEIAVAGGLFQPRNYDAVFRGPVSVRTALAGSLNVPAVRALQLLGADPFADRLRALGFDGLRRRGGWYGPALALGSADVTLWELVGAYRVLASGGAWSPLRLRPDEAVTAPRPVLAPAAAFIVADILADRAGRAVTFGLESPLSTRFWSAAKTGTSTDMRDNWCLGFSRRFTVGVWVGNFSGAPMHDVSGVSGAAPIWQEVMEALHRDLPSPPPAPPPGLERVGDEWFVAGTAPGSGAPAAPTTAPRILAPTDGTIIALDPEIGAARQRLALEAADARDLRWQVDGQDLGDAERMVLWPPTRGRHRVALVDATGTVAATAGLDVRGR